jgi:hypothetical protein
MNQKRILIGASALLSCGAFLWAANPRLVAWSQTANSNLIAEQRAATCDVMRLPVELGQSVPLNPGRYACHFDGSTGQVSNDKHIVHIKNGSPERIQAILKQRGYTNETHK